jgi:hypothetical protein
MGYSNIDDTLLDCELLSLDQLSIKRGQVLGQSLLLKFINGVIHFGQVDRILLNDLT